MHSFSDQNGSTSSAQTNYFVPQFSSPTGSLHTSVSKIAQESLREVKRLRILLTRLLNSVDILPEEANEDDNDQLLDNNDTKKISQVPDSKAYHDTDVQLTASRGPSSDLSKLPNLTSQICEALEALDQLASRFQINRLSTRFGEMGLINALSVLTSVDQLDFYEHADHADANAHVEPRRSDWLSDRSVAEMWSSRYWERTHTIMEGLLSCSIFRRSHLNSAFKRNRISTWSSSSRDSRLDLERLLTDIQCNFPHLTFTLFESGSSVLVVHVKVAEVMQCLITFRRLHPESIIVRGLSECVLAKSETNTTDTDSVRSTSKPIEELLRTKIDSPIKDLVTSLLNPEVRMPSTHDQRAKRGGAQYRTIHVSPISIQQLDLVTQSRFKLFQRITALAKCALLHFSNDYQPPSALRGLFVWLHSYHDLFTAPCGRCGYLLGQNVTLPVWRTYQQVRKDDNPSMEPQHEHCQVIG